MNNIRYWKEPYFNALAAVRDVAEKNNLTLNEIALRWISHHSMLKRDYGDAILIGASSLKHIEEVCSFRVHRYRCLILSDILESG